MKTIFVDDERGAKEVFEFEAENLSEFELVGTFDSGKKALEYARKNPVELAILDIEIGDYDGIVLGSRLREINPDILIIYITGHEEYAMDAIKLHAAAYLLKPYTSEELYYAAETARLLSRRRRKRIYAKTFGHFDLFVDGKPIMFRSGKAKELLALLIDRQGGTVNTDQIICALWEDRPNDEATQNLCSKVAKGLLKELKENNAEGILITNRGVRRVDTEVFDCDLYDLLEGDVHIQKQFTGEYMLDYSWAEERMAQLERFRY